MLEVKNIENAPEGSRELLLDAKKKYGFVPNLYGVFANSPSTIKAYTELANAIDEGSLSDVEKQLVLVAVSAENGCDYCVAAHSTVAGMVKAPEAAVNAVREQRSIDDDRLEALRTFAVRIVRDRGHLDQDAVSEFLAAGFEESQILEVLTLVTLKTLSNYTNHIADTPLDGAFQPQKWEVPATA